MAFAVSEGKLTSIARPVAPAPYALRLSGDFTRDYAEIYRTQPEVRTVVAFLARNIAQLSLHTFRRVSDTDRERLRDHPLSALLSRPNAETTQFRLFRSLVSDLGIYDAAAWLKVKGKTSPNELVALPAHMTRPDGDNWLRPEGFVVKGPRGEVRFKREDVVWFHGYNPTDPRTGLSPIETLRRILAEEHAAGQMREQTLRNGARASGYLTRPKDAPKWSDPARARFRSGWRAQYQGWSATDAGGTPILEDGMQFVPASQTAVDLQYVESRKLTREEVAAAYFIPPPMVGILDNATFSNIQEQHKMLYQDTLGPWLQEIQQEIELQLLPDFDDTEGVYVEFNMAEKLRGSFEEQAAQLQTSVGAPYMTRNEARARANLPSVEGGDELVVPLNVLVGGQASPSDSGSQNLRARSVRVKDRADSSHETQAERVLVRFFERQRAVVLTALGAKQDPDWWDADRWDDELADDLFRLSLTVSTAVAVQVLASVGFGPGDYDPARTHEFLREVARARAGAINSTTRDQLVAILSGDGPEGVTDPGHVFELATAERAAVAAVTLVTTLSAFGSVEAARQNSARASKTWIVTSGNPRASHAAMHGETVPVDSVFSNGARWPGDSSALDVDDIAGCQCDVQVNF